MTRVNPGLLKELTDDHLLSEYREMGRITTLLKNKIEKGVNIFNDIPNRFKLEEGHMKFFLDKGKYLVKRFELLKDELKKRGFNITIQRHKNFYIYDYYPEFYNDYYPDNHAISLIKERIALRIINSKQQFTYYRNYINNENYIKNTLKTDLPD